MSLGRLWAGWRMPYVTSASSGEGAAGGSGEACVFCGILASDEPDESTLVVWRGELCFAVLNAYPYASGHLMVLPYRHVGAPAGVSEAESAEMWSAIVSSSRALEKAYEPDGLNIGANLGRAAGAGLPDHLHFHVLPRWTGDTNFMTTVAEARVLPESLSDTWSRVTRAWPA
jgi:ATP adenylyltransferase